MLDRLETIVTVMTVVGCGLLAGLWFMCSVSLMIALRRLPAEQGIKAMQGINVAILNPAFGLVFGGTTIACLFLAVRAALDLDRPGAALRLAAALVFLIGTIVVTMAFNVPLNDALAAADPASEAGTRLWERYLARWTAWNHVRLLSSGAAVALLAVALLRQ